MTGRAHVWTSGGRFARYVDENWSRYASRGRAGVKKRLGGRIQRNSRQRSAAKHNAKNGAEMYKAKALLAGGTG